MKLDPLETAKLRCDALARLAWESLPELIEFDGEYDDWNTYAPATIGRCAYLVESIVSLAHRDMDAGVLLRVLYEHAVTWVWISAAPAERMRLFVKAEREELLKLANDWKTIEEKPLVSEEKLEAVRQYVASVEGKMPGVRDRATHADRHFNAVVPQAPMEGRYSFAGLYSLCFRQFSAHVHPTAAGLRPFVFDVVPGRFSVGRPAYKGRSIVGSASVIIGIPLLVAGATLGWPDCGAIGRIYERYPV